MASNKFCEAPLGVFRRVAGNVPSALDVYFITKNIVKGINFGSGPSRDVIFEWKEQPKLSVVVNNKFLHISNIWRIRNENGIRVFLNDKFLKKKTSSEIISGDQIRFGLKESLYLIYSFQLYSAEHPATPSDMKFYLEFTLINFETKAQECNRNCSRLLGELENVQKESRKKRAFFENERPIAAFQLISSNVTGAPPLYFLEKSNAMFGKSPDCDIVIESGECWTKEAFVKEDDLQWKITNLSFLHQHFINERYFKRGETLVLESQDRIRLGGTENFDVIYEFKLYFAHVPPADMQLYVDLSMQKLQKEVDNTCMRLQSDLERFQKTVKNIDNTRKQIKFKLDKINATIISKKAAEKVKRTKETNVGGNKKIKTELLGDGSESAAEKVEKTKENVCEGNKEMKTELRDESESTDVAAKVKEEVVNKVHIKTETVEDDCVKNKSAVDKVEKTKEIVCEGNKEMKTELMDESESTAAKVKQEKEVINKVNVEIKTEAVEEDYVEISIKKEFPEIFIA